MNDTWNNIVEALRAEVTEYGALTRLFEEQQKQLFARNADGVLRLSGQIEEQVRVLHDCRVHRETLVAAFAGRHGQPPAATLRSLLPFFSAAVRPLLDALIGEVNLSIHRVRRMSRQNHTLLARTLETHQLLLRQLRPELFTQTYAPDGRVASAGAQPSASLQAAG